VQRLRRANRSENSVGVVEHRLDGRQLVFAQRLDAAFAIAGERVAVAVEEIVDVLDVPSIEVWVLCGYRSACSRSGAPRDGFGEREVAVTGDGAFQQVAGDAVEEVTGLVLLEQLTRPVQFIGGRHRRDASTPRLPGLQGATGLPVRGGLLAQRHLRQQGASAPVRVTAMISSPLAGSGGDAWPFLHGGWPERQPSAPIGRFRSGKAVARRAAQEAPVRLPKQRSCRLRDANEADPKQHRG
jgi:hypothetical protein